MAGFCFAGGRPLPKLLVVWGAAALADLPPDRRAEVAAWLATQPSVEVPPSASTAERAVAAGVRAALASHPGIAGVLLLGGHDAVPAHRVHVIPDDLRPQLTDVQIGDDLDNFDVWSDDLYSDADGDGLPDLPVSRIPKGTLWPALQAAPDPARHQRRGIRDADFGYAVGVFGDLPGPAADDLLDSPETDSDRLTSDDLAADRLYLPLHGRVEDATLLWGGIGPANTQLTVIKPTSLPDRLGAVTLCGACWGALTVNRLAYSKKPIVPRTPATSIAAAFVDRGIVGFAGFTSAQYVPYQEPYDYYVEPLHRRFWHHHLAGSPPAEALFRAKQDYVAGIPHPNRTGPTDPLTTVIELKAFWSATCLGLGW